MKRFLIAFVAFALSLAGGAQDRVAYVSMEKAFAEY